MAQTQKELDGPGVNDEPWEKAFDLVVSPFEEFIHRQSSGSLLLALAAIIALAVANSPLSESYFHLLHSPIGFSIGSIGVEKSFHHWVNDGLMTIFFFVVGLELRREFLIGELANKRNAVLPVFAAVGGMVVPALVFSFLSPPGAAQAGWGIPMATDIAFAVGVLALLGSRIPKGLFTFMIALAIVDDLGAVLVIALFYTDTISVGALATAAGLFLILMAFKHIGIRRPLPYLIVATFLWFAFLQSGVHATLAGIIAALTVPVRPKYDSELFGRHVRALMDTFDAAAKDNPNVMTNLELRGIIQTLENGVQRVQAPLQRLEQQWHIPVAYFILPVFAFTNAGLMLDLSNVSGTLTNGLAVAIFMGLIVGKFAGIAGFSVLAIKTGLARLPTGVTIPHIVSVSFLGGIGFTMSIFVSELAYVGENLLLTEAKLGIFCASLVAGLVGYFSLRATTR